MVEDGIGESACSSRRMRHRHLLREMSTSMEETRRWKVESG